MKSRRTARDVAVATLAALTLLALTYLLAGCALRAGPLRVAFGQADASVCGAYSITTYPDGRTEERLTDCDLVVGGALSDGAVNGFAGLRSLAAGAIAP